MLHPPASDFAAGGEPHSRVLLHVVDDFAQGAGSSGAARNVGVELKGAKSWMDCGFFVEIVEMSFPHHKRVVRIPGVPRRIDSAVAKRLAREFDEGAISFPPDERNIVSEGVAVPHVALFHEQLQAVGALSARAPAHGTLPGAVENHRCGSFDDLALFFFRKIARDFVMITVPCYLVTFLHDGLDGFRVSFGNCAAG